MMTRHESSGFTGAHRFYFGKPLTGILWFFTGGLLLIGWIIDLFLIPSMDRKADLRFTSGKIDYNITWILLTFLGLFGIHRMYMGKWITGIIYLFTAGLFGIGWLWDLITLNEQKMELIEKAGIDVLICIPFNMEFAALSARTFVEEILVNRIGMRAIVVGQDYTLSFYLAATDRKYDENNNIVMADPLYQIYLPILWKTLWLSALITFICLLIAYPVAYLLATLPLRTSNLLMIMVLLR